MRNAALLIFAILFFSVAYLLWKEVFSRRRMLSNGISRFAASVVTTVMVFVAVAVGLVGCVVLLN